jgi:serine/threonine-protein kinase HipA
MAAAGASILDIKSRSYYVSERYDREDNGGYVRRILQEDFCQAMGVPAEEKYESDGGPSAVRCFRFLRDEGFGFAALTGFVDALAFNFIVGNADAHAKNFAILYRDGKASLAPLYDILSTAAYPNLTPRMAMNIGGAREFDEVTAASFDAFAEKCDINPKFVRDRVARLSDGLAMAMDDVSTELSDTGHPSQLYKDIAVQSQRRLRQLV